MTVRAKKFVYVSAFKGEPKYSDFELVEEDLPQLKDGEFQIEALYWSVDPYMRPYMARYPIGVTMIGGQVAKIIDTKNDKYPKDKLVFAQLGWRTHSNVNPEKFGKHELYLLPDFGSVPVSLGLGTLGMPGNTAYFGFLKLLEPKKGETLVVTGAAGAVGTLVGQIGKLQGCRVIGFAGSDDKCKWLETEYGFDKAINYKSANLYEQLREAAPSGIDLFFDNVGGEVSSKVFSQMNDYGRIAVCGAIASYNDEIPKVNAVQSVFVFKQLSMHGFLVWRWSDRWMEGINHMLEWVKEGKIKYHETTTDGFENLPKAFIEMLRGVNYGKAVVKAKM